MPDKKPRRYLEHFENPANVGRFPSTAEPIASGEAGDRSTGDLVRIDLLHDGNTIEEARFRALGCTALIASGSVLTELYRGKTLAEARRIDGAELAGHLDLADNKRQYADQAVEAGRAALENATNRR